MSAVVKNGKPSRPKQSESDADFYEKELEKAGLSPLYTDMRTVSLTNDDSDDNSKGAGETALAKLSRETSGDLESALITALDNEAYDLVLEMLEGTSASWLVARGRAELRKDKTKEALCKPEQESGKPVLDPDHVKSLCISLFYEGKHRRSNTEFAPLFEHTISILKYKLLGEKKPAALDDMSEAAIRKGFERINDVVEKTFPLEEKMEEFSEYLDNIVEAALSADARTALARMLPEGVIAAGVKFLLQTVAMEFMSVHGKEDTETTPEFERFVKFMGFRHADMKAYQLCVLERTFEGVTRGVKTSPGMKFAGIEDFVKHMPEAREQMIIGVPAEALAEVLEAVPLECFLFIGIAGICYELESLAWPTKRSNFQRLTDSMSSEHFTFHLAQMNKWKPLLTKQTSEREEALYYRQLEYASSFTGAFDEYLRREQKGLDVDKAEEIIASLRKSPPSE